jgi:DNA helicase HerA-like ATPase
LETPAQVSALEEDNPNRVGLVDGLFEGTSGEFRVALDPDRYLQLDDVVVTHQNLPDGTYHSTYGIVTEVYQRLEGASYLSDTGRIARDFTMVGENISYADVRVLRNVPEIFVPAIAGALVERAAGEDRIQALYLDQMGKALPIALDNTGQAVSLDLEFVDGTRGGHVSISGVSGVATKTSFALHLLYLLLETEAGRQSFGVHGANTKAVVFNVKGEDLLHFDKSSSRYQDRLEKSRGDARGDLDAQWRKLGVDAPGPFSSVSFYAPVSRFAGDNLATDVESRPAAQITPYGWPPYHFIRHGLLRFCFSDVDDTRNQLSFIEQRVRVQLARWAYPCREIPGAVVMMAPEREVSYNLERLAAKKRDPVTSGQGDLIRDFRDLVDFLERQLEGNANDWTGQTQLGTVNAFMRRLHAMTPRFGHLITDKVKPLQLDDNSTQSNVVVVDIHNLHEDGQRFVVGSLLSGIFEAKERGRRFPLNFVVLDELNKYAPRQGSSPLKEVIIDIAARGRSLGVILIGAQQSASEVETTVVRNAAIRVVGRLDAGEASHEVYRFLSPEIRERCTRLLPGSLILDQPMIPAPVPIRFPFPNYATRADEVPEMTEEEIEDEFNFR